MGLYKKSAGFGRIDCSGEDKATCVNRELAAYPGMLSQRCTFAMFVRILRESMRRLCLPKPSGPLRPRCESAVSEATEIACDLLAQNLPAR